MSFKHQYFVNWTTEDLQEWIQESKLFNKQEKICILMCIKAKELNGYHFYLCDNLQDIKDLCINDDSDNNFTEKWYINDVIAKKLYEETKCAKQKYGITTEDKKSDNDSDIILNNQVLECKSIISWTIDEFIQFIQALSEVPFQSQQILISKIKQNQINGSKINKCSDALDLQYLFKLSSQQNRTFFEFLWNTIQNASQKITQQKNAFWDKHVFNWNSNDIKNWLLTLGPNMSQYIRFVIDYEINGLFLMLCTLDSNGFDYLSKKDSVLLLQYAQQLCKKYNITNEELKNKKRQSQFGLIGLCNQGNTCFMNTASQLILQSPGIYQELQLNSLNAYGNIINCSQYSKWDPRHYINNTHNNCSDLMIDLFTELHFKSKNHKYNCIQPTKIFNRICEMDNKYKQKRQQDCAAVMSLILQDMDQNLNDKAVNINNINESEHKDKDIQIPFSSNIVVKQELTYEQEQLIIHKKLLKKHNPYGTVVRQVMDGVQKIVSTCMYCNWKRIEYETFRSLKLPLINNEICINIDIYIPNNQTPIKRVFKAENYTKIYALKHQIAELILDISDDTILDDITMDSIVIGSILPSYDINDWIRFYDSNEKCLLLSSVVNVFATVKWEIKSKLVTLFDIKINENAHNQIIYCGLKFVEIAESGSISLGSIAGNSDNNICIRFQDRIIDATSAAAETEHIFFESKTNVLILIEMENNELKSKWFPYITDCIGTIEQWIIQDCANRYNIGCRKNNNYIKHVPLSCMIKDLKQRLKHSNCNNNFYIESLQKVLNIIETQYMNTNNIIKYLSNYLSVTLNNNVMKTQVLDNIIDCITEYEREKILDFECSQMYCKRCGKKPKVFREKTSIVYSPLNLTFRIERLNEKQKYNDKFNHLVSYPDKDSLILGNGSSYNLYGIGVHSSHNTLQCGHYIAYIKSIYNGEWYEISDSSVYHIKQLNKIQSKEAIILMYTKSRQ